MEVPIVPRPADAVAGAFWTWLDALLPIDGDALDVGTGTGRVALAVAPRSHRVLGIDIDRGALEAARWDAGRRGLTNARFLEADAETADLGALNEGVRYALVTARLFLSPPCLARVPQALGPDGQFLVEALESDHWREAGGSRFNASAPHVIEQLAAAGMTVERACIERQTHTFPDAKAAEAHLKDRRLWTKWRADGRWDTLRASLRSAGTLTESHLVLHARRT